MNHSRNLLRHAGYNQRIQQQPIDMEEDESNVDDFVENDGPEIEAPCRYHAEMRISCGNFSTIGKSLSLKPDFKMILK